MPATDPVELFARLSVAVLIGASVGINRDLNQKPAGLRTHALVALGAALAVAACESLARDDPHRADVVSRVMQGILTGIGFLGAGVILRDPGDLRVHGLTTAAAIWVTALFGAACGIGAYRYVALAALLMFVVLLVGGPIERLAHRLAGRSPGTDAQSGTPQ